MYVRHLSVVDFRSWERAELALMPGSTVLIGRNGSGKTNLVEAIGYLATLGSHRVSSDVPLIRRGAAQAVVRAAVVSAGRELLLEAEITSGRANRVRINRAPQRRPRDLLGILRTVLFAPEDLALVRGDPTERREFLDELLVMRAPRLAGIRSDYDRALRQRSALLKTVGPARRAGGDLATLAIWDEHLAAAGSELMAARLRLVDDLRPHVAAAYRALAPVPVGVGAVAERGLAAGPGLGAGSGPAAGPGGADSVGRSGSADPDSVDLVYRSSLGGAFPAVDRAAGLAAAAVDRAAGLAAAAAVGAPVGVVDPAVGPAAAGGVPTAAQLHDALIAEMLRLRSAEMDRGVCLVGPHRDDLELRLGPGPAKGYASHGESWSFALALRLGAFGLLRADGVDPVLVLDDVFAELDVTRRDRLAALVADAEQVIITAAVLADVPDPLAVATILIADGVLGRQP